MFSLDATGFGTQYRRLADLTHLPCLCFPRTLKVSRMSHVYTLLIAYAGTAAYT